MCNEVYKQAKLKREKSKYWLDLLRGQMVVTGQRHEGASGSLARPNHLTCTEVTQMFVME